MKVICFHKLQWIHFTGEVYKFIITWCDVSSGFSVPNRLLQSVNFWLGYFKKIKVVPCFEPACRRACLYREILALEALAAI